MNVSFFVCSRISSLIQTSAGSLCCLPDIVNECHRHEHNMSIVVLGFVLGHSKHCTKFTFIGIIALLSDEQCGWKPGHWGCRLGLQLVIWIEILALGHKNDFSSFTHPALVFVPRLEPPSCLSSNTCLFNTNNLIGNRAYLSFSFTQGWIKYKNRKKCPLVILYKVCIDTQSIYICFHFCVKHKELNPSMTWFPAASPAMAWSWHSATRNIPFSLCWTTCRYVWLCGPSP